MLRMEPTADDSLAAMRARSKFGIAIAAMIRMIATTISSSISEKPFCLRILNSFLPFEFRGLYRTPALDNARAGPRSLAPQAEAKRLVINGWLESWVTRLEKMQIWADTLCHT